MFRSSIPFSELQYVWAILGNVPLRNEASNDYGKVHGKVSLAFDFFDMTDARKEKRAKAFAEMEHTMA